MYGVHYQLIVCMLVLLICSNVNMFKNRIDKYIAKAGYTKNNMIVLSIS